MLIRRHWITYIPLFIIIDFMLIPLAITVVYTRINASSLDPTTIYAIIVLGSVYALCVLSLFLFGFVDYYLDVDIVTNERVVDIEQNGFFHRTISELYLEQVEDVTAEVKGVLPTLFNFGNIYIQTAGERENFVFKSVPRPYETAKMIIDLHEAALEGDGAIKKLMDMAKAMPGSISSGTEKTENDTGQSPASEAVVPLSAGKEAMILSGINNDKKSAEVGDTVTLYTSTPGKKSLSQAGEMHEGETVDI